MPDEQVKTNARMGVTLLNAFEPNSINDLHRNRQSIEPNIDFSSNTRPMAQANARTDVHDALVQHHFNSLCPRLVEKSAECAWNQLPNTNQCQNEDLWSTLCSLLFTIIQPNSLLFQLFSRFCTSFTKKNSQNVFIYETINTKYPN